MGDDGNDFTILWPCVFVWPILSHRVSINAGYAHHWRLFENTNGRRLLRQLWRRKFSKGAGLSSKKSWERVIFQSFEERQNVRSEEFPALAKRYSLFFKNKRKVHDTYK